METTAEATPSTSPSQTKYWIGKLFSLVGILPIGIYVLVHLYHGTTSLSGAEAFNAQLAKGRSMPFIVPIMILIVWIPIFFHGIYGLLAIKDSRPNLGRFRYFENLKYILQRLSGIGLLLFIPAHLYNTRIGPTLGGHEADFNHMAEGMSQPITLAVYLLGILGVAYHLANGVWQASIGWGLVRSQKGMNRVQAFSMILFLVLLSLGYAAIWGLVRG
jgi:succinate dehydrogenase / fumarate reductase cytochrome b subunit